MHPCVEVVHVYVSTHAPLAGSDKVFVSSRRLVSMFQLTLPLRGATAANTVFCELGVVSTHAPLAGSDNGRLYKVGDAEWFQLTLPLRGATRDGFLT